MSRRGLRVLVDERVCIGSGQCEVVCPEVFEVDEVSRVKVAIVDPANEDAVRVAARACPSGAITVEPYIRP